MSTTSYETEAPAATHVPSGRWQLDPVHSIASFSVRHMMVGTFRGEFSDVDATLTDGKLVGRVKVDSLQLKDGRLSGHLLSPDFFDAERFPEIVYESESLTLDEGVLISEGTLTLKGVSTPVTAHGRLAGPATTLGDVEKIGLDLEATLDREAIGLGWNAPLPAGGFTLGAKVTISVTLELSAVDEED